MVVAVQWPCCRPWHQTIQSIQLENSLNVSSHCCKYDVRMNNTALAGALSLPRPTLNNKPCAPCDRTPLQTFNDAVPRHALGEGNAGLVVVRNGTVTVHWLRGSDNHWRFACIRAAVEGAKALGFPDSAFILNIDDFPVCQTGRCPLPVFTNYKKWRGGSNLDTNEVLLPVRRHRQSFNQLEHRRAYTHSMLLLGRNGLARSVGWRGCSLASACKHDDCCCTHIQLKLTSSQAHKILCKTLQIMTRCSTTTMRTFTCIHGRRRGPRPSCGQASRYMRASCVSVGVVMCVYMGG
jgi:hypothetical protein